MTETSRWALPLLEPGQAQKEMFHNEALVALDLVASAAAIAVGTDIPPSDPVPGECWIVGNAPEGAWSGHARALAGWTIGGWRFVAPREGLRAWAGENAGFAVFTGGNWRLGHSFGKVFVEGVQVVGSQRPAVAEPTGGVTVDGEARTAIVAVLEALRAHGLVESD